MRTDKQEIMTKRTGANRDYAKVPAMKDTATPSATHDSERCHCATPVTAELARSAPITEKPAFYMF
jgi:hypothetical protein